MDYVADTHAMIWYLFAQSRLGQSVHAILKNAEAGHGKICLPAVVVAEMIMVIEKKRLPGVTMNQLEIELHLMRQSACYEFLPLLPDLVIASRTFTTIPDIFDQLVVAEAHQLGLPLLTNDTIISASGLVKVIWN